MRAQIIFLLPVAELFMKHLPIFNTTVFTPSESVRAEHRVFRR